MKKNIEVTSEVWKALEVIAEDTGATKDEMEYAIEWFLTHYFEMEDEE